MGLSKDKFKDRDIYLDHDFEEVMFKFNHKTRQFFKKFYGEENEYEVIYDDELLNEAMRFGDEIDERNYKTGKPGDDFQKSKID